MTGTPQKGHGCKPEKRQYLFSSVSHTQYVALLVSASLCERCIHAVASSCLSCDGCICQAHFWKARFSEIILALEKIDREGLSEIWATQLSIPSGSKIPMLMLYLSICSLSLTPVKVAVSRRYSCCIFMCYSGMSKQTTSKNKTQATKQASEHEQNKHRPTKNKQQTQN